MINIVVVGSGGSGKSALCIRYVNGTFTERYERRRCTRGMSAWLHEA